MKIVRILLLIVVFSASAVCADSAWFLPRDCSGSELTVSVHFDGAEILQSHGPACDAYEDNRDGRWKKETLTVNFKPNKAITWTGYREDPFDSPSDSILKIDLWLAGADKDESIWFIGVSVSGADVIYMNTIHSANLESESETCIAPGLCVATALH